MQSPTLHNERGVALFMAIVTMLLLGILAAELVYDTEVYHRMVFNQVDELRAKMLAKSGLKLAVLQLQAKQKALAKAQQLGLTGSMASSLADRIWQTPIILPPPALSNLGPIEKENIDKFNKDLGLQGRIAVTITGESNRLSLNQLVWVNTNTGTGTGTNTNTNTGTAGYSGGQLIGGNPPPQQSPPPSSTGTDTSQTLQATATYYGTVLSQLISTKSQDNESFRNKHQNTNGEILIQNLLAWMNPNVPDDGDRAPKLEFYSRATPEAYFPKEAPLCSISELHMVKGFDDDIFQLVADNFTVAQTGGVNINEAPISLLRGIIPELTESDGTRLDKRRHDLTQGGPFASVADFWTYLNTLGNFQNAQQELGKSGTMLVTDETSYRISINASSGNARKNWIATVGALPPSTTSGTNTGNITSTSVSTSTATNSIQVPSIIYLKTD